MVKSLYIRQAAPLCHLLGTSKRDVGFAGVLVIVPEIDGIAGAIVGSALATQGLGMHGEQILLGIAQANVLVVGGRLHVVGGERFGEAEGLHLNPRSEERRVGKE